MRRAVLALALLASASGVWAQEGEWRLSLRGLSLGHDSRPCAVLDTGVQLETSRSFGGMLEAEYMVTDHLGIAISLTSGPVDLKGMDNSLNGATAATMWFSPLSVTTRYEFAVGAGSTTYVGLGAHGSFLLGISVDQPLLDLGIADLEAEAGFGFTGEVGYTYDLGQKHFVNLHVVYMDAKNDLKYKGADGEELGKARLAASSWSFGLGYGWRF